MTRARKQVTLEERAERIALATRRPSARSAVIFKNMVLAQLRAAVRQELEACARECDELVRDWDGNDQAFYANAGELCASRIRRRKKL